MKNLETITINNKKYIRYEDFQGYQNDLVKKILEAIKDDNEKRD